MKDGEDAGLFYADSAKDGASEIRIETVENYSNIRFTREEGRQAGKLI